MPKNHCQVKRATRVKIKTKPQPKPKPRPKPKPEQTHLSNWHLQLGQVYALFATQPTAP